MGLLLGNLILVGIAMNVMGLEAALTQDSAPETVWVLEQGLHPRLGGLRHGTGLFP